MPALRAAPRARASAALAALIRRRRIAMPAATSSWAARDAGGSGAESKSSNRCSAWSRRPIRSRRRIARCRACAALARSPCRSSTVRAESSGLAGQPSSRETRAISASATTQRARATASRGPKARAARRSSGLGANEITELRHRDAPQRQRRRIVARAMKFKARSGSPAASARAAAVVKESIQIPTHLSLPPLRCRRAEPTRLAKLVARPPPAVNACPA